MWAVVAVAAAVVTAITLAAAFINSDRLKGTTELLPCSRRLGSQPFELIEQYDGGTSVRRICIAAAAADSD